MKQILLSFLLVFTPVNAQTSEVQFRRFITDLFIVELVPRSDGQVGLVPGRIGMIEPRDLICAADDPDVQLAIQYAGAERCGQMDDPGLNVNELTTRIAEETETALRQSSDGQNFWATPDQRVKLRDRIDAEYKRRLSEAGLYNRLMAAWRKHIAGNSTCYQETRKLLEDMVMAQVGTVECGAWQDMITVCMSWSQEISDHIAFHIPRGTPPRRVDALKRLQEAAGLRSRLAEIIQRHGRPDLIKQVRDLSAGTSGEDIVKIRQGVWRLWEQNGMLDWLSERERR